MSVRSCPYDIERKADWRKWVTPIPLKDRPVDRWFYFPHSFTGDLVHALINEWGLSAADRILDPFCGAGTTLVAAKQKRVGASGYDLSPLAVLVSSVKCANLNATSLERRWAVLQHAIDPSRWNGASRIYPMLVHEALPGKLLGAFDAIWRCVEALTCSNAERKFFQLAVLRTLRSYSRLVPTGGWLSWTDNRANSRGIMSTFSDHVRQMIEDVASHELPRRAGYKVIIGDARCLPDADETYAAAITSPPYPNRHDYTRVFGVELMFGFLNWMQTRKLRYQSFESHPEAKPCRPAAAMEYIEPPRLTRMLGRVKSHTPEERIPRMLRGYFLDAYLCLREAARVCRGKAHLAWVVGNAQYCGVAIPVDELLAELGEQAGLRCRRVLEVRLRGNSAQQMGVYGRRPSRESVVEFLKP